MKVQIFLVIVMCLYVSSFVGAATLHVPFQYPTIQAAIDAAQDGDEIIVADGIYTGPGNRNIDLVERTIFIRSANGPTHCIIDCLTEDEVYLFNITGGAPVIEGFTIKRCSVENAGPAIQFWDTDCVIRNCIFTDNAACLFGSPGTGTQVVNCTFYGNTAHEDSGTVGMIDNIHNDGVFVVRNSVFWNNQPKEIDYRWHTCKSGYHPGMHVEFTILESHWQDGVRLYFNNCTYGQDPLLTDPNNGDFHLKSQMGRWDAFNELWVKDDVTSPAIDFGHPDDDYGNEPWPHGKHINAGAYGNTPEASLSVVSRGNPADFTGNDMANYEDFSVFSGHWQTTKIPIRSDFDRDGSVGLQDMLTFAHHWLTLTIDPTLAVVESVAMNESITVDFIGIPGNAADWLGICEKGASIEPYAGAMLQWVYTDGTQTGTPGITENTVVFAGISDPGDYEVRLFFDDGYAIKDRRFFTVRGPGILNCSPDIFSLTLLEDISPPKIHTLTLQNSGGDPFDWSIDTNEGLPMWLSISPGSGTLASNQSQSVTLSFNIAGLLEGAYSYAFDVYAEDALDSPQEVQVNLKVVALPGDGAGGYYVSTAEQLVTIGTEKTLMDKRFELLNDIDLSEYTFDTAVIAPGTMLYGSFQGTPFTGQWDGKGHVIRNLQIDTGSEDKAYLGLFGYANNADIQNLSIENAIILTGNNRSDFVGLLAGIINNSTVSGCFAEGQISASNDYYVGGLAGSFGYGEISNCYTDVTVSGMVYVGSFLGRIVSGSISNCYAHGQVYGHSAVGGLIGSNNGATPLSCYFLDTAGPDNGIGGALTDIEMKQQASFVGWDFLNIWTIVEGSSYPYLSWQVAP